MGRRGFFVLLGGAIGSVFSGEETGGLVEVPEVDDDFCGVCGLTAT